MTRAAIGGKVSPADLDALEEQVRPKVTAEMQSEGIPFPEGKNELTIYEQERRRLQAIIDPD